MQPCFVLIPLCALLVANLPIGPIGKRLAFPFAIGLATAQTFVSIFLPLDRFSEPLPFLGSLGLRFDIDNLSLLLILCVGIVSLVALCVGYGTIKPGDDRHRFSCLLILSLAGMNGIAMVRDLFSLYVFLEITAVSSYILIAFDRERDGLEGSFKYLILSAVATFMMLASVALFLLTTGDTSFAGVASSLSGQEGWGTALVATALYTGGLCIKAGLVPFHGWLPDAYSAAPSAVSVLLAGIVTKTTGVYSLMRLCFSVFAFKLDSALVALGILSILVGALAALGQRDIKRMLAYSSLSQVGYIVLGLGAGSALGIAAACFHLFNHAIFKTQLFVNAAAIERQAGTRNLDEMGGLSREMPITGWSSVIAFLSAAGAPPLAGFWSKLLIVIALWRAGQVPAAVVAVLASLLTLAYFLVLQRKAFFAEAPKLLDESTGPSRRVTEAPIWLTAPAIALALISLGVGIFFPLIVDSIILPIARIQ
jgi:proton-translocating NADH-quinone oxidoreductase chain N